MSRSFSNLLVAAAAAASLATAFAASAQQAPTSIRIGWAISKTGPYVGGASITTLPAYQTWVKDVNAAGGIMLKSLGKKLPIEVIEYDDRSNSDEMIKAVERLATQDKVDFILPPWGTGFNLAAGPILHRYGYPHLAATANTDKAPELAKRWPNSFWFLGTSSVGALALVDVLTRLRDEGKIGNDIAMVSVADQFGIELSAASRAGFKKAKFNLVYDKSYPLGTQDMQPLLTEAMRTKADVFVAFSYPPDTFAISGQARVLDYNPKVFYTAVGTAFPMFKEKFGASAEGQMGIGGIDPESPAFKAYVKRHVAETGGREPDRWANPVTYASLEILQQAIERVGRIDRAAIIKEIQTGTFDTVIGKVKLKGNLYLDGWQVGQWQGGEYYGIYPASLPGARPILFPKPAWKK
ncbi:MAG: amino acid ABC transporter substrate-binding protein [Burkholderiales bacterium]|nr:amino acid ABC transporter substrate-binding protein [Burkholderiales bacterium]